MEVFTDDKSSIISAKFEPNGQAKSFVITFSTILKEDSPK